MTRKHGLQGRLLEVLILIPILATQAHAFSGGSGTRIDPYLIATAEDLVSIGSDPNLLQSHFRLVNDIDLDPNLPGGKVFDRAVIAPSFYTCDRYCSNGIGYEDTRLEKPPIEGTPFDGTFDGFGHRIRNLTVNGEGGLGFIGRVGPTGVIHDLALDNASITDVGGPSYGAILASENEGVINNCHVEGDIHRLGGALLVKFNHGIISFCHADGTIVGDAGLVEYNAGFIRACFASARQTWTHGGGGLVMWNAGTIMDCYAVGEMEARCASHQPYGGLVSFNMGNALQCYTNVNIRIMPDACSSLRPDAYPNTRLGPMIGKNHGVLRSCYYLAAAFDNGIGISVSDAAMRDAKSFVDWEFHDGEPEGDKHNWFMPEDHYPVLSWQTEYTALVKIPTVQYKALADIANLFQRLGLDVGQIRYDHDGRIPVERAIRTHPSRYAAVGSAVDIVLSQGPYDWADNAGSGSPDSPFQISTPGQFNSLTDDSQLWDKHFVLTQDIDMSHCLFNRAPMAWDVNVLDSDFQGVPFQGGFDGRDFSIRGFNLIASDWSIYTGLFGLVHPNALISNLRIENALVVIGHQGFYTGILTGRNQGSLSNCHAAGIAIAGRGSESGYGTNMFGGLVGVNEGDMADCDAEIVIVTGRGGSHVGGLVGQNLGSIAYCRSAADILTEFGFSIGGLVGHNVGDMWRCMASVTMTIGDESHYVGGLVGHVDTSGRAGRESISGRKTPDGPRITREHSYPGNEEACVTQSYAMCDGIRTYCCTYVGGLIGSGANVSDCYTLGSVIAQNTSGLGGLVGYADGLVQNCYVAADITASDSLLSSDFCGALDRRRRDHVGGGQGTIIGEMDEDVEVTGCFYLINRGTSMFDNGIGDRLEFFRWRELESFIGWDFLGETENGTEDIWFMPEGGYPPMLAWEAQG